MSLRPKESFPEWTKTLSTIGWAYSFWATLLYEMLKVSITEAMPTLAVGGGKLYVNRGYFTDPKFDDHHRVFMVAHELSHEMLDHPAMLQQYQQTGIDGEPFDAYRMNMAMDYCINDMLVKWKVGRYHKDWLLHPQFTYEDGILDVYRRLRPKNPPRQPQSGGGGQGSGQSSSGQSESPNETDQTEAQGSETPQSSQYDILDKDGNVVDETPAGAHTQDDHSLFNEASPHSRQDWKQAVAGAYQQAKEMGHGTASMERWVDEFITPKRDWKRELWDYVTPHRGRDTFNWQKPHKRKLRERGIPIPTRYSHKLGVLAWIYDVSGSVSQREHMALKGAGVEICTQLPPKQLRVLCCASSVTDDQEFDDPLQYADWQPKGGGGTDMQAGFRYLMEDGYIPDLCIVLTDGWTSTTEAPPFPVLWISTDAKPEEFNYGHVIMLDLEE